MDDSELAKYPGLVARSGIWTVRKRVPVDLRHAERRKEIRLTLNTSSLREAIKRYPSRLAEIEAGFEKLRHELRKRGSISSALALGKLERISTSEIETLVADWWARREAYRAPPEEGEQEVEESDEASFIGRQAFDEDNVVQRTADRLLVDAGIAAKPLRLGKMTTSVLYPVVNRSTPQYRYLCDLIARALPQEAALASGRVASSPVAYEPLFNTGGEKALGQPFQTAATHRALSDLITEYRSEREVEHGKESTDRKYGLLFRVLNEVIGSDIPVSSISRSHCVEVRTFLRKLPPNATKRFPHLSLGEAVQVAEEQSLSGLAPNSVASYMQSLNAILNWAELGGWGVKANMRGLIDSRDAQVKRRGFQPNELRTLFAALEQFRDSKPARYWVPALALFTGARANELCQLRAEDVVDVDGIKCLNLTVFDAEGRRVEDKRLKTHASERYVPLHEGLMEAGFQDFVASFTGRERLFPELTLGPNGSYSHGFSKWFGRFRKSIGLAEASLVFHSFRHGFRDACRRADISDDTARALGGWTGLDQAARYGDRDAVPVLHRAIRKLDFGGFGLTCHAHRAL